jgi:hypothetical protein
MTLGLDQWLRLFARFVPHQAPQRSIPPLDLGRMTGRDIADLNLPQSFLATFAARQAEDMRRRVAR